MNISMWDVYFVMQLDNIINGLIALSLIGGFSAIIFTIAYFGSKTNNDEKTATLVKFPALISIFILFFSIFALCFFPSSKTAAAMIVLPKIANSELVNKEIPAEAKEIWNLAKEGLKNLVAEKASKGAENGGK